MKPLTKPILTLLLLVLLLNQDMRAQSDSILTDSTSLESPKPVRHWGFSLGGGPGWVIAMDKYVKMWLKDRFMYTVNAEVQHHTYPSDNDDFAADYNYPTISLGLRYGNYASTTMHKTLPGPWGTAEPVDYHSRLGNSLTAYLTFARPFFRTRHWEADYTMGTGIGYSNHPYNKRFNIDNELIGSRWLIYFVAGVHATYKISPHWGVKAGAEFAHLSNGALNRPNKGSNAVTPTLSFLYYPNDFYETDDRTPHISQPFERYWYMNVMAGVGGKSLWEEWSRTQNKLPKTDPAHRKGSFAVYAAYSLSADIMYRYTRRWASGAGIDLFYGEYASRLRAIDEEFGHSGKMHNPLSLALAAKHEVFYHNTSLKVSLGFYVNRHMGYFAKENEQIFYERVGVHHAFPKLNGLQVGFFVKAHLGKADLTELTLTYPIRLTKQKD